MPRAAWPGWLLCLATLLLTAAPVLAQPKDGTGSGRAAVDDQEARDLFRLGKQAFDEGRFERALKYFKDAYDLSHRAALLSNIGTVLDRLRRDQEALDAYRQYLNEVPEAPNRALIEERVQVIETAMAKSGPSAPPSTPPPLTAEPALTPAATARAAAEAQREDAAPAPNAATAPSGPAEASDSGGLLSRWWFWAGVGTIAAATVVVSVAASSGGGGGGVQSPAVLTPATRVREL